MSRMKWLVFGTAIIAGWIVPACAPSEPESVIVPSTVFRDCPECPELVVVPAGSFLMGSILGDADEYPIHLVDIRQPFAIGKFEVTFQEWEACVEAGGCRHDPQPLRFMGRERFPVVNVSWDDAKEYVDWLTRITGNQYRLPTEAEWEYAARAGTSTNYWWGDEFYTYAKPQYFWGTNQTPHVVGRFPANSFGLHDVHVNVYEWVQDCWHDSYLGAPVDGSAWTADDCGDRVIRSGSMVTIDPWRNRSASRVGLDAHTRSGDIGFRVVRTLNDVDALHN